MASEESVTLEKVYRKLERLEEGMSELRHSVMPMVKLSKKELAEITRTSNGMKKGKYLTAKEAISFLEG